MDRVDWIKGLPVLITTVRITTQDDVESRRPLKIHLHNIVHYTILLHRELCFNEMAINENAMTINENVMKFNENAMKINKRAMKTNEHALNTRAHPPFTSKKLGKLIGQSYVN